MGELVTEGEFERLVAGHRRELLAHCYRMLGSIQDAEDALQEALLGAWRGWGGFEGRSSARAWLYRICTNACLRLISRRPRRVLSPEYGPALKQTADWASRSPGPCGSSLGRVTRPKARTSGKRHAIRRVTTCGGRAWSWRSWRLRSTCRVPSGPS